MRQFYGSDLAMGPPNQATNIATVSLKGIIVAWVHYDPDAENYAFCCGGRMEELYARHQGTDMVGADDVLSATAAVLNDNGAFFAGWIERALVERNRRSRQNSQAATLRKEDPVRNESLRKASPHDILQAWQDGVIDYHDAMELTASENLFELFQACRSSGVEFRKEYTAHELNTVNLAVADLLR